MAVPQLQQNNEEAQTQVHLLLTDIYDKYFTETDPQIDSKCVDALKAAITSHNVTPNVLDPLHDEVGRPSRGCMSLRKRSADYGL